MIHHLPRFASVCAAAPSGPAARLPAADVVAGDVTSPVAAALDPRQSPVSVSMDQALTASPASSSGMVRQREPNLHVYSIQFRAHLLTHWHCALHLFRLSLTGCIPFLCNLISIVHSCFPRHVQSCHAVYGKTYEVLAAAAGWRQRQRAWQPSARVGRRAAPQRRRSARCAALHGSRRSRRRLRVGHRLQTSFCCRRRPGALFKVPSVALGSAGRPTCSSTIGISKCPVGPRRISCMPPFCCA